MRGNEHVFSVTQTSLEQSNCKNNNGLRNRFFKTIIESFEEKMLTNRLINKLSVGYTQQDLSSSRHNFYWAFEILVHFPLLPSLATGKQGVL
jgi:hypothetical protein